MLASYHYEGQVIEFHYLSSTLYCSSVELRLLTSYFHKLSLHKIILRIVVMYESCGEYLILIFLQISFFVADVNFL